MVCTSLGSLLHPLFYFLCSNLKANPVHCGSTDKYNVERVGIASSKPAFFNSYNSNKLVTNATEKNPLQTIKQRIGWGSRPVGLHP